MANRYLEKLVSKIKDTPEDYKLPLKGVSGTVILFIVFCFIKALVLISNIIALINQWNNPEMLLLLKGPMSIYLTADLGLCIAVIVFIFKKNILFRKLFVIDALIITAFMTAAFIYFLTLNDFYEEAFIYSGIAGLWVLYLYMSKRIKNTYIYPHADFKRKEMIKFNEEDEKKDT